MYELKMTLEMKINNNGGLHGLHIEMATIHNKHSLATSGSKKC